MTKIEIKTPGGCSTKRLKREATDDASEEVREKKTEEVTKAVAMRNDDGDSYFELGSGRKRCTVRKWKTEILIDIREVRVHHGYLESRVRTKCSKFYCCCLPFQNDAFTDIRKRRKDASWKERSFSNS